MKSATIFVRARPALATFIAAKAKSANVSNPEAVRRILEAYQRAEKFLDQPEVAVKLLRAALD